MRRTKKLTAKKGLERKTPLRAATKPLDRTAQLTSVVNGKRWGGYRLEQRRRVVDRANNHCEHCGIGTLYLQWAHVFGRNNQIGEPLASLPELTVMLCPTCHATYDEHKDEELRQAIQWKALRLFEQTYGVQLDAEYSPLDAVRKFERELEVMAMSADPISVLRSLAAVRDKGGDALA